LFTQNASILQTLVPIIPETGLTILLLIVLTVDLFLNPARRRIVGIIAGVGMLIVMVVNVIISAAFINHPDLQGPMLGGMVRFDVLSLIFRTAVLIAGGLSALIALDVAKVGRQGEFYGILIVATLGMTLMCAASDLMLIFLAVETASICLYVLAGFLRDVPRSTEAGLKYFLFGSFTSGLFLYGLSLLYGFTGTTSIYSLAEPLGNLITSGPIGAFSLILALLLLLAGFGFKIAAVPFHFWTPDVYEGAPTPVTAFVSTASKAASFALLVRVFSVMWPGSAAMYWTGLLAAIAVVTMTLGNLLALVQRNMKRMLAYSSIAQAGYTLIGVVALTRTNIGVASVAFYMLMYVLTNIAAFTVVIAVSNAAGSDEIRDFAGLSRRSPYLALAMAIALLSLSGVPPLAGFFGKFFLFAAAIDAGYVWLAVVGVLNAIVALYYYLTVIKLMYVDEAPDTRRIPISQAYWTVLGITCFGILFLGTFANPAWEWAINAANSLVAVVP